jgi:uncharacterized protein
VPFVLLVIAQVAGLLLIPLGFPGIWLQVAALAAYGWYTDFATIGWWPILLVAAMAAFAEAIEFVMGGRFAAKYGGSRRAAWGAIIGGVVGGVIGGGVIFLIGGLFGALIGSFLGAMLFELTLTLRDPAWRSAAKVGWGALIGRMVATVIKSSIGVAIAVISLFAAL